MSIKSNVGGTTLNPILRPGVVFHVMEWASLLASAWFMCTGFLTGESDWTRIAIRLISLGFAFRVGKDWWNQPKPGQSDGRSSSSYARRSRQD